MASLSLSRWGVLLIVLTMCAATLVTSENCGDFDVAPNNTVVNEQEMACFMCDYPDPGTAETWERDGTTIMQGTDVCDCFLSGSSLCFNSVTDLDVGTYTCFVQVGFGTQKTCSADLSLAVMPEIDKSDTSTINVNEGMGETLTIPVTLTHPGSPQATVTFEKDGVMLNEGDSRVSIDGNTLTISDVIPDDRGVYTITATNSAGSDTFTRTVSVNFIQIQLDESLPAGNEVTLTCVGVYFPGSGSLAWDVVGDSSTSLLPESTDTRSSPNGLDFTTESSLVVDLNSCIPKPYQCTVMNLLGWSSSQTASVCPPPHPDPPTINVEAVDTMTVEVSWQAVPLFDNYTIQWRVKMEQETNWFSRVVEGDSQQYVERFTGLMPGTEYEFQARTNTNSGGGEYSEEQTVTTFISPELPVVGVVATADATGKITLTWQESTETVVTGYFVYINPLGEDETFETVDGADVTSLEVDVECDVMYEFKVQAFNLYGQGQNSSTVQAKCTSIPNTLPTTRIMLQTLIPFGTAITVNWFISSEDAGDLVSLRIIVEEYNAKNELLVTHTYSVGSPSVRQSQCVGELNKVMSYRVCLLAVFAGNQTENVCDRTITDDDDRSVDLSTCLKPSSSKLEQTETEESGTSVVIPDWGIAVIVVGVLALVALVFCLIGVCFACQSSKKGEGPIYSSASDISSMRADSGVMAVRMHQNNHHHHHHRPMSPTRSCLSYHAKGHSTNWNDHVDTLRQLESGAATSV